MGYLRLRLAPRRHCSSGATSRLHYLRPAPYFNTVISLVYSVENLSHKLLTAAKEVVRQGQSGSVDLSIQRYALTLPNQQIRIHGSSVLNRDLTS